MAATALAVAEDWPESAVWSAPCIKPLDAEQVAEICRRHEAVIVLEEHSVYGGLGSAVAEIAAAAAPSVDLPHRHRRPLFRSLRQLCVFDARTWFGCGIGAAASRAVFIAT